MTPRAPIPLNPPPMDDGAEAGDGLPAGDSQLRVAVESQQTGPIQRIVEDSGAAVREARSSFTSRGV